MGLPHELGFLRGHSDRVTSLVVLRDQCLASSSLDQTVRIWDVLERRELAALRGHTAGVCSLALCEEQVLASGSVDRTIRLWSAHAPFKELGVLHGHKLALMVVAALQGLRLASGCRAMCVKIWDVQAQVELTSLSAVGTLLAMTVLPACFGRTRIVLGCEDTRVHVWDHERRDQSVALEGHAGSVSALIVMPNGMVASGSRDKTIKIWDLHLQREVATLRGHKRAVLALALTRTGRLLSGSSDCSIKLWDTLINIRSWNMEIFTIHGHGDWLNALAVLPDGMLASASGDHHVGLWDLSARNPVGTLSGHRSSVTALLLLPPLLTGGKPRLASGSEDREVKLWDVHTTAEVMSLPGHQAAITALALLDEGFLLSASLDHTIRVWNIDIGCMVRCIVRLVTALTVLPYGRIVTGCEDRLAHLKLWDTTCDEWSEVACFGGHGDLVDAVAALPRDRLASGSRDKTIKIWDVSDRPEAAEAQARPPKTLEICTLKGHEGRVTSLMALPRDPENQLVSSSADGNIKVWNLVAQSCVLTLNGHGGGVCSLALLPNGWVAMGSRERCVQLWTHTRSQRKARSGKLPNPTSRPGSRGAAAFDLGSRTVAKTMASPCQSTLQDFTELRGLPGVAKGVSRGHVTSGYGVA